MDACRYFYTCGSCGERLKPKKGDCCVFCSYGTEVPTHSGQFQLLRIRPRAAPLGQYGAFSLLGPVLING